MAKPQTIPTVWELRTYDVWGNAKDGFEVNDVYLNGKVEIDAIVRVANIGTPHMFVYADIEDSQLRKALGISGRIETDWLDDMNVHINRPNGYPICELLCISHASLSPIRNSIQIKEELAHNAQ